MPDIPRLKQIHFYYVNPISLQAIVRAIENPGDKIFIFVKDAAQVRLEIIKVLNAAAVMEHWIVRATTYGSVQLINRSEIVVKDDYKLIPGVRADQILMEGVKSKIGTDKKLKAFKHFGEASKLFKFFEREFGDIYKPEWMKKRRIDFSEKAAKKKWWPGMKSGGR